MSLEIRQLDFAYRRRQVLFGIDLTVGTGEFMGLLGPNGSGKSTLTKVIAGVLRCQRGSVTHAGVDLGALSRRERAKLVAYVPQKVMTPHDLTVRESVMLGRNPHYGVRAGADDRRATEQALDLFGLTELADRPMSDISGGQAQRATVARALAQEAPVLLLDEPTSALDLRYQVETLTIVRDLTRRQQTTAMIVIHDLNHAARYCDSVALLDDGRVVSAGPPDTVYEADRLSDVYGLPVDVHFTHGHAEVRPTAEREESGV